MGIVTNRDLRFETRLDAPVKEIMTPRDRLVSVREGATLAEGKALMHKEKLERVLVVNDAFELRGLMTVKDITKQTSFPNAARDGHGKLRVGAAIGVGEGTEERAELLVQAGVDAIVVDTAHGHSAGVIERVRWVKRSFPNVDVIAGNIATGKGALDLVEAGADAVKVGIGPGSICTTRIVTGVGVPQIMAIDAVAKAIAGSGVPLIADGGVRFSGDLAKAIAAGADTVMMGGAFAGTEEAPGEVILFQGRTYKSYRGMGSIGAMQQGSADRYFQEGEASASGSVGGAKLVPEGIEGQVPYKGSVVGIVFQMGGGLRAAMQLLRLRQTSPRCTRRPSSSRSPRRASARATSTTCRSPRKRRTTGPSEFGTGVGALQSGQFKFLDRIMRSAGIFEAKQKFSQLIDAVEAGEEVRITRHGKEIVRMLPVQRVVISDEQIERELKALGELQSRVKPGPGWKELRDEGRE